MDWSASSTAWRRRFARADLSSYPLSRRLGGECWTVGTCTSMARNSLLDDFLSSSVQSGGQMMILITNMGQAIRGSSEMDAEPETIEREIVEIVGRRLQELGRLPDDLDLEAASRVLRWATEAIGDDLFGPRPEVSERNWVPEMRFRLRSLEDEPLPLDDDFPPPASGLLN